MKKILYTLIILGMLSTSGNVYALPYYTNSQTIVPFQNNLYDLGTTSLKWRNVYIVGSDGCLTLTSGLISSTGSACGAGAGSGGGTWSTTTSSVAGQNINYPNETDDIVVIGSNATTSAEVYFDPNAQLYQIGNASTASTTLMGAFRLPNISQGWGIIGSNGLLTSVSTSTLASHLFTFNAYGMATATITNFVNGMFTPASSTFSGNLFLPALSQGIVYTGSNGLVRTRATSTASCSGSVSCSTFDILGGSTVTITGTDSTASTTLLADHNSWSGVNRFNFASSTYHSFLTSSTTDAYFGTGQGIAYIGSGGRLRTTATSTFSLSQFTNDLSNLTATDATLTFSGNYNGSVARTVGLNLGNANTWTAKQNFFGAASSTLESANWAAFGSTGTTTITTTGLLTGAYSSSTIYSSHVIASSTSLFLGTGQGSLYTGSGQAVRVVATSTATISTGLSYSGTWGQLLGGTDGTLTATLGTTIAPNELVGTPSAPNTILTLNSAGTGFLATSSHPLYVGSLFATSTTLTNTFSNNNSLFGTTTGHYGYLMTFSSSTVPQISLSAGAGVAQWTLRNAGGSLYIATTTTAGSATSTTAMISLTGCKYISGCFGLGSTSPVTSLVVNGAILTTEAKPATSTTQVISLASSTQHLIQNGTSALTVTLTELFAGQVGRVVVCNPAAGTPGTVGWATVPAGLLLWPGGTAPTQTTTVNKCDLYTFTVSQATSTSGAVKVFGGYVQNF